MCPQERRMEFGRQVVFSTLIGRVMDPKDVHILIPRTYKYVTLHSKRDSADVIKLRD